MSRLKILKSSLKKKEDKFNKKINDHFGDVASANGQQNQVGHRARGR